MCDLKLHLTNGEGGNNMI